MFESDLLDRLSRVHPAVPPVIFLPAVAILFLVGAPELTARPRRSGWSRPAGCSGR